MVIMKAKKVEKPVYNTSVNDADDEGAERSARISKEIRIIAQEVNIVRALACNDVYRRNKQLRKLRKWLQIRARSSFPFSKEDFLRIWKGLYYNMWMSDKPLVQEELAEDFAKLLECFDGDVATSVNFFGAFIETMCNEWFGIDQWRTDKFMMLVRRMLRSMFRVLKRENWSQESVQLFNEHMAMTVLADECPAIGLTMHFLDIFFEELAKVADGDIDAVQVGAFVRPFVRYLGTQIDVKLVSHCRKQVLYHLLYQSTLGREYMDKYNAWKEMGFPTTSIHDLELEEVSTADEEVVEEETESQSDEKHLDPRAGNVDVVMPELPFDGKYVVEELEKLLYKNEECSTKRRKVLRQLLDIISQYQQGKFPLGVKRMPRFEAKSEKPLIKDKINQLERLENEMYGVGRKLKQLNKRKRRKLLRSLKLDNVDESNFDQTIMKALPKQYLKERKRKAQAAMMNGWVEEELSEQDVAPNTKINNQKKTKNIKEVGKDVELNAIDEQNGEQTTESGLDEPPKKMKKLESGKKVEKSVERTDEQQTMKKKVKKSNQPVDKKDNEPLVQKTARATSKETKTEANNEDTTSEDESSTTASKSKWETPLAEGEIEYFIPSRKVQLRQANADLVINPLAKKSASPLSSSSQKLEQKKANTSLVINPLAKKVASTVSTPVSGVKTSGSIINTPKTPGSTKRVKIALKHNTVQNPSEYIRQIKSSPNVPYDAEKKPGKGLLKPNSMPSPINPFYKKKIGLRLMNDTV